MATTTLLTLEGLCSRLDEAVRAGGTEQITANVKATLEEVIAAGSIEMPASYFESRTDGYARRLVHHCPDLGYTITAMTWGPGQGTPVHDHDGMWCVEGVVAGRIQIVSYELLEQEGERHRFQAKHPVTAGIGSAGRLIPPFDHHTIGNPFEDPAITLHVYSGVMERCSIFVPEDGNGATDGWYLRQERDLVFDN